jgi:branched-chain amino acid transport system substrate-binding protein
MKKIVWVCFGVLLITGLVFASLATAASKTLNVGILHPLTGPASGWGLPSSRGVEIQLEGINAGGGLKIGNDTYHFKIFKEDDEYSPEKAATGARKLVERDKVKVIFGSQVTHTTLPILPITTRAKVINFAPAWSNKCLSKEANAPYAFLSLQGPHELLPALFEYVFQTHPEVKRVAEFAPNTMSGIYGTEVAKAYLGTKGIKIVAEEYSEPGTKDFQPFLVKILAEKPDIIHSTCHVPAELALMIKQSRELGYKGLFMQEIALAADFLKIAGPENANGLVTIDFFYYGPEATPEFRAFHDAYAKEYGGWDGLAMCDAGTVAPYLKALQLAGTVDDPAKVVKILESNKFLSFGVQGWFDGSKKHYYEPHHWGHPVYITEVKGGVNTIVGTVPVEKQFLDW